MKDLTNKLVRLGMTPIKVAILIMAMFLVMQSVAAKADEVADESIEEATAEHGDPIAKRVGGNYRVEKVTTLEDGRFEIRFTSVEPTGRFDVLTLVSDHVHVAVKTGQEIRLSAEILSETGSIAEVAQMVLFLPSRNGRLPVWLLSTKATHLDLRGARYLEMHVPLNDFFIM